MATGKTEKVITKDKLTVVDIRGVSARFDASNDAVYLDFLLGGNDFFRLFLGSAANKNLFFEYYDGSKFNRLWTATIT